MAGRGWRVRLPGDMAGRRTLLALALYAAAFVAVGGRLVAIQVVHADEYAASSMAQRARTIDLPARRGRLYDREGDVLATSVDAATVYADPRAYRPEPRGDGLQVPPAASAEEVASALAPLLGTDQADLLEALRRDAHFVYLARAIDWEIGERIRQLDLPGIGVVTEPRRQYPAGELAAQVVGFTGLDGTGLHGLELAYDSQLRGEAGELAVERAPGGLSIASGTRQLRPPEPGADLVLTLDREIQHVARDAAQRAVDEHDAQSASVVVLDVGSGEVLAMTTAPGFDPNSFAGTDPSLWRNRAVTDAFEPGSVQKAVTAAAALEEGVVTADTPMLVHDRIEVAGRTFSDAHDHEPAQMTFQQVIESSSNVGTIMVARDLGPERLSRYLDAFGYGRQTGVGYPGEGSGLLPPVDRWWGTSLPTIAIGQGVAVTLLQAASVYATVAGDGTAVQPRLVRGTVGGDGRLTPVAPPARQRVISTGTARTLRQILGTVVAGERGTGGMAAVAGYDVAGKTGTARKPKPDARGYSDEYAAVFVGMAPVDRPRLVVAVMVDDPTPIWGGVVAAPVFSEVMGFALTDQHVPPTVPPQPLDDALEAARSVAAAEREPGTGPAPPG